MFAQEGFKGEGPGKEEEIDYCTVLNRFDCPCLARLALSGQDFSAASFCETGIFLLKFA